MNKKFPFALQVTLVLFCFTQTSGWRSTRNYCTNERSQCLDCQTLLSCNEDPVEQTSCTDCGFVCGDAGEVAACYKNYDGLNIDDENTITNANCSCLTQGGQFNALADGNYTDPYSSVSYVECRLGFPSYHSCGNGMVYDSSNDLCVTGLPCPTNITTPVEYPLNCHAYVDCPSGLATDCDPITEIFDINNVGGTPDQCIDPMDTACDGMIAPGSVFRHNDVCYLYLTCDIEDNVLGANCCPRGEYYDDSALQCEVDTSSGLCDQGLCVEEYWEQNYCNQCVDDTTNYATREICSQYYFNCEDDGQGGYTPNLAQCPANLPYFDPIDKTCKAEADVLECNA